MSDIILIKKLIDYLQPIFYLNDGITLNKDVYNLERSLDFFLCVCEYCGHRYRVFEGQEAKGSKD